jgi:hypothetical protein
VLLAGGRWARPTGWRRTVGSCVAPGVAAESEPSWRRRQRLRVKVCVFMHVSAYKSIHIYYVQMTRSRRQTHTTDSAPHVNRHIIFQYSETAPGMLHRQLEDTKTRTQTQHTAHGPTHTTHTHTGHALRETRGRMRAKQGAPHHPQPTRSRRGAHALHSRKKAHAHSPHIASRHRARERRRGGACRRPLRRPGPEAQRRRLTFLPCATSSNSLCRTIALSARCATAMSMPCALRSDRSLCLGTTM